jgi:hypothetical protein
MKVYDSVIAGREEGRRVAPRTVAYGDTQPGARAPQGSARGARRPSPPLTCARAAAHSQLWRAANRSPESNKAERKNLQKLP